MSDPVAELLSAAHQAEEFLAHLAIYDDTEARRILDRLEPAVDRVETQRAELRKVQEDQAQVPERRRKGMSIADKLRAQVHDDCDFDCAGCGRSCAGEVWRFLPELKALVRAAEEACEPLAIIDNLCAALDALSARLEE